MGWGLAGNTVLATHASEMPPRVYKKAHRHSSEAFILVLSGEGYSLIWQEGGIKHRLRFDWKPGSLFVPPTYWYHQHFNLADRPARYLAVQARHVVTRLGLRYEDQLEVDSPEIEAEWEAEVGMN